MKLTKQSYAVDDHVDDDCVDNLLDHLLHVRIDLDDHFHNYGYYEMFEIENFHDHRVDCLTRMVVLVGLRPHRNPGQQFVQMQVHYQNLH